MTQALAVELAKDGVRVNALAPGVIATPMTEVTRSAPEKLEKFMLRTPMSRVGQAEELIGPVVFLASEMLPASTLAMLLAGDAIWPENEVWGGVVVLYAAFSLRGEK